MVQKVGNIDGMPLYSDPYMEDNKVLHGRKQGVERIIFMVANPKTAKIMIQISRKRKIEKLNKYYG